MTPRPHGRSGRSAAKIQHPGDFTGAFVAGGETCFGVPDPNSPIPKRMCLPIFYREALFLSPHFFDGLARGRIGSFAERIIHVGAALVVPLEIKRVGPSQSPVMPTNFPVPRMILPPKVPSVRPVVLFGTT